jgi:predicted nuclease of predicted toxin-antitoxin system
MHFLADENFNNQILRGLLRRVPDADITRVQDTELAGAPDTVVLEWAVENSFIVLSHDVNTMRGYYYDPLCANIDETTLPKSLE